MNYNIKKIAKLISEDINDIDVIHKSIDLIREDQERAEALYAAISQFENDPGNVDDEGEFVSLSDALESLKKAVQAYEQGMIYIDKVLNIAAKTDWELEQDYGMSGIYQTIINAAKRDSVPYDYKIRQQRDSKQLYDYADKKWAIVIPGYDVRSTIYTILDSQPSDEDVDMFVQHITVLYNEIDAADLWQLDESLPELPPTIDKDEWGRYIAQEFRESGGSPRDIEAAYLMHPRVLRQDAVVTTAWVLTDELETSPQSYVWDTSKITAPSYMDALRFINKEKPALVIGNREQYLEFDDLNNRLKNPIGRLITAGSGDPWYIRWSDIGHDEYL